MLLNAVGQSWCSSLVLDEVIPACMCTASTLHARCMHAAMHAASTLHAQ